MKKNAAGLVVSGEMNPNWRGGLLEKSCAICGISFKVKRVHSKSRFCSLRCVGVSQRGISRGPSRKVSKTCEVCGIEFKVSPSHADRYFCCSSSCSARRRARINSGDGNPNWNGGISRRPYPWNFREISRAVIARDGGKCQSPECRGVDARMTTHHINYDKTDCRDQNLIALCSSCNTRANFNRREWQHFYEKLMATRLDKARIMEEF